MNRPLTSPWGSVQNWVEYAPGLYSVGTPSHGGFMIHLDFAAAHLSEFAIRRGKRFDTWLCYEEDCAWAIPVYELVDYWPAIFQGYTGMDPQRMLWETLSAWNPDYLIVRGVEPEPVLYGRWQESRERDRLEGEGHPDLIVGAFGDWHTHIPGVVEVVTADRKHHRVTEQSYGRLTGSLRLLSQCELVT